MFLMKICVFFRPGGLLPAETASGGQGNGPPNRPLPPTPDEDAQDRTLIMKRVSCVFVYIVS